MFENVKAFCDSFLPMGIPGGDLYILQDGKELLRYTFGYSDLENKTPVKGDEQYYIHSCSKPLTCVAAMQLWEKGMFKLDDPISDYLPEFAEMTVKTEDGIRKATTPITIKNLFTMTAGLNYDRGTPAIKRLRQETNDACPTRLFVKALAEGPLDFEPGDRYQYSLCHDVLAVLVEVLSGQKFEDYVKEHIFLPLGMTKSTFLPTLEEKKHIVPLYRFNQELGKPVFVDCSGYNFGTAYASGSGGAVSTVEDYVKFLEALRLGDVILKKETIDLMTTNHLTEHQMRTYPPAKNYGYGLGMRTPWENGIRTDFGWGGAGGAYLAVDRAHNMSVYYAQHLLESPNQGIRPKAYYQVLEELYGLPSVKTEPANANKLTY